MLHRDQIFSLPPLFFFFCLLQQILLSIISGTHFNYSFMKYFAIHWRKGNSICTVIINFLKFLLGSRILLDHRKCSIPTGRTTRESRVLHLKDGPVLGISQEDFPSFSLFILPLFIECLLSTRFWMLCHLHWKVPFVILTNFECNSLSFQEVFIQRS